MVDLISTAAEMAAGFIEMNSNNNKKKDAFDMKAKEFDMKAKVFDINDLRIRLEPDCSTSER